MLCKYPQKAEGTALLRLHVMTFQGFEVCGWKSPWPGERCLTQHHLEELKELLVHRVNRVPGTAMLILTQHGVQRG